MKIKNIQFQPFSAHPRGLPINPMVPIIETQGWQSQMTDSPVSSWVFGSSKKKKKSNVDVARPRSPGSTTLEAFQSVVDNHVVIIPDFSACWGQYQWTCSYPGRVFPNCLTLAGNRLACMPNKRVRRFLFLLLSGVGWWYINLSRRLLPFHLDRLLPLAFFLGCCTDKAFMICTARPRAVAADSVKHKKSS